MPSGRRPLLLLLCIGFVGALAEATARADSQVTGQARQFIQDHVGRVRPLELAGNIAWWNANISGSDEDFKKKEETQNQLDQMLADRRIFAQLKTLYDQLGQIDDPLIARQIDLLYLQYLPSQVDLELLRKINAQSNLIEKAFNEYRARVGGVEMTDSQVRRQLKESNDSARLQEVWEASKGVGARVQKDLHALVKLRNESALKLGFKNYYLLQLYLNEQNDADLIKLFDELDELTREPFAAAKADIDSRLAARYKIAPAALLPWHYQDPFFQQTPAVSEVDSDAPFRKADLPEIGRRFYQGIGLPVDRVLAHSDLYEKKGKSPHAFCTDIDCEGDVRVLANLVPNSYWASTLIHELGHSTYSSLNIPAQMPYTLRTFSHILTTEGVAMMFERVTTRQNFLREMGLPVDDPAAFEKACAQARRHQLLIFSRWCQVLLRFEKGMYENPDQDLNALWWNLVEKYQLLKRPPGRDAPDYASKIHIVNSPVYYHNYMLGELFASQVHHAIVRELYPGADPDSVVYVGNPRVGEFMKKRVYAPGRSLPWNELTRHATGEDLNPRAFLADFKGR